MTRNDRQPKGTASPSVPRVMQTVDKALGLLQHFSVARPEFGLSELARRSGHDKATVLRSLSALERHGIVEQDSDSKKYRLGMALLNLARVREISFPVTRLIQPIVDHLADVTGETSHASMQSGGELATIALAAPQRSVRVFLEPAEVLPIHATASGLAMLAFATDEDRARMLTGLELVALTDTTITDMDTLNHAIARTRTRGYSVVDQGFEEGVTGTSAPIFGPSGKVVGAVSVAAISSRFTPDHADHISRAVIHAAHEITRQIGGPDQTHYREAGE